MIGLLLSTVGLDMMSGAPRFTFGIPDLMGGINFIPVMIGMFALNELMLFYGSRNEGRELPSLSKDSVFKQAPKHIKAYWPNMIRGSSIGTLIGALPGAGADIAALAKAALNRNRPTAPAILKALSMPAPPITRGLAALGCRPWYSGFRVTR